MTSATNKVLREQQGGSGDSEVTSDRWTGPQTYALHGSQGEGPVGRRREGLHTEGSAKGSELADKGGLATAWATGGKAGARWLGQGTPALWSLVRY